MKQLINTSLFLILVLFIFQGCRKVEQATLNKSTSIAKSVKEIVAPNNFNWSTSNIVNFKFNGITGDARKSTLVIFSEDNSILFKKLQNTSESFLGNIEIPAHVKTITVVYNNVSTEISLSSNNFEINVK